MTTKIEHDTNLDAALATYSGRATTQSRKSKGLSMLGYTAAAGGMAFTGGDAVGAVVYNGNGTSRTYSINNVLSTTNFASAGQYINIDLDGAGGADLAIYLGGQASSFNATTTFFGVSAQATYSGSGDIAVTNTVSGQRGAAVNLTTAQFVGTGLNFLSTPGRAEILSTFNGANINSRNFVVGTNNTATGYLGVRFEGDTGARGTQYGWLKVRFNVTFPDAPTTYGGLKMTILASAFDNCGDAIQVGATSGGSDCSGGGSNNVDSPATPLLALLGLGATGVTTYRRRREAGLARMVAEAKQQAQGASADA